MLKRLKIVLSIVLCILVLYVMVTVASIGRFSNTHAIIRESNCTDCHIQSLKDLNDSRHIGSHYVNVGNNQSMVIDYYFNMAQSADINGMCLSCHNGRRKSFGMMDPYIYNISGNNSSAINGIVFWDPDWETNLTNSTANETITVTIGVWDVYSENASVSVDSTIQLMNFSGQQDSGNLSTNVMQSLYKNQTLTFTRQNVYPDYFKVYISLSGIWQSASIYAIVDNYPMVIINASNSSSINYYSLPADLPLQYSYLNLFHTRGNYTVKRMDRVMQDFSDASVVSISSNELMEDYIGNSSRYSCGTPAAMCHINDRITYMGQTFGLKYGRYYAHEIDYVTTKICKTCHI